MRVVESSGNVLDFKVSHSALSLNVFFLAFTLLVKHQEEHHRVLHHQSSKHFYAVIAQVYIHRLIW